LFFLGYAVRATVKWEEPRKSDRNQPLSPL